MTIAPIYLKDVDPDRFLLSFFVRSGPERAGIMALDMLNYELARVRDVVDTPHMGWIRLQWWRDEIRKLYAAGVPAVPHPVLSELKDMIARFGVPFEEFDALIAAREADFEEYDSFDMTAYARAIHAPLMRMKARILGEVADTGALAEGFAVVGLIRAIPFYRAQAQVRMPDIQPDAVKLLCDRAGRLLAQNGWQHRYFRAHQVLARLYVDQLDRAGYKPEHLTPLPFKELRVWWHTICAPDAGHKSI